MLKCTDIDGLERFMVVVCTMNRFPEKGPTMFKQLMQLYAVFAFQCIELVFFDLFEFSEDILLDFKVQFIRYLIP